MLSKIINKAVIFIAFSGIFVNSAFAADPLVPDAMQVGLSPTVYIMTASNFKVLDIPNNDASAGVWMNMWSYNGGTNQQWNMDVATDGSFRIKSHKNPALCLGFDWHYDVNGFSWIKIIKLDYCSTSMSQKFYIQHTSLHKDAYVIRSVETSWDGLNVHGGAPNNGTWVIEYSTSKPASGNEIWYFTTSATSVSEESARFFSKLADFRALQMHDSGSARVPAISYAATSPMTTGLSANAPVSDAARNYGTNPADYTINWATSLINQFTFGVTQTTTVTLGTGKESPVNFSITQAIGTSWSWLASTTTMVGGIFKVTIPPGAAAWMIRSHPVNTVTGKFTIYNDLNASWVTDTITASIPLESSGTILPVLVACDTLSQAAVCLATKPAGL